MAGLPIPNLGFNGGVAQSGNGDTFFTNNSKTGGLQYKTTQGLQPGMVMVIGGLLLATLIVVRGLTNDHAN